MLKKKKKKGSHLRHIKAVDGVIDIIPEGFLQRLDQLKAPLYPLFNVLPKRLHKTGTTATSGAEALLASHVICHS